MYRTAWLVYILDTIASLDKGAKIQMATREVRHIPLPCSTAIWHASTAKEWWDGMMGLDFRGATLDDVFTCMAKTPLQGTHIKYKLLYKREIGPYARHILILTLLRGIIDYGMGRPRGGYITKRWILPQIGGSDSLPMDVLGLHSAIISIYTAMLNNVGFLQLLRVRALLTGLILASHWAFYFFQWRQGWDLDGQCHTNYRGTHFINDALPPYWLCRALLDRLAPPPPIHVPSVVYCPEDDVFEEDGPNRLRDLDLREMFQASRQFVSHGEGLGVPLSTYMYDPVPGGPGTTEPLTATMDPSSLGAW